MLERGQGRRCREELREQAKRVLAAGKVLEEALRSSAAAEENTAAVRQVGSGGEGRCWDGAAVFGRRAQGGQDVWWAYCAAQGNGQAVWRGHDRGNCCTAGLGS